MRTIAITTLLLPVLCAGAWAYDGGEEQKAPAPEVSYPHVVAEILSDTEAAPNELGRRLAARGVGVSPILFAALENSELVVQENTIGIGAREQAAILDAATRLGRRAFLPALQGFDPETSENATRRAVLLVIGAVGKANDLDIALMAAAGRDPEERPDQLLVRLLEDSVATVVARDPGAYVSLRQHFFTFQQELSCAAAQAVGRNPSLRSVEWLVELLGFEPRIDAALLSQIARASRGVPETFEEPMLARVREYLDDTDLQLQRQAAMAIAELGDFEAVDPLIELLGHEQKGLRESALWALREITGLQLLGDQVGWRSWLETERTWYAEEAPTLIHRLTRARDQEIAEAMAELAKHRYQRHRTSLEIAQVLDHRNSYLRKRACAALLQLGSTAPVPRLVEGLEDEEGVAGEVHRTLKALTGRDLPLDAEAWRALSLPALLRGAQS